MSDYYPSLPALLGKEIWVEQIVRPFLQGQPCLNWGIKGWVEELPNWLRQMGKEELSDVLVPLANLEKLHIKTFFSQSLPLPKAEQLGTIQFSLQPHLHFFSSSYPLLSYRQNLLKGLQIDSIQEGEDKLIALSLNRSGNVVLNEIDSQEKTLLEGFNRRTLDEVIDHIAEENPRF